MTGVAVRSCGIWPWLAVLAVVAYLLLPGHPLGLLHGIPLDALSLGALLGLGCVLYGFGLPRGWRSLRWPASLAVLLVAVKLALWWTAPTYGLAASYYARLRPTGSTERSTEFRSSAFTRIEASPGLNGLALSFFNDVERFNFYEAPDPDRNNLPFTVRWDGYLQSRLMPSIPWHSRRAAWRRFRSTVRQSSRFAGRDAEATDAATLPLTAGSHALRLELISPSTPHPSVRVDLDTGTGPRPLAPPLVTVDDVSPSALAWDRVAAAWALILDGLVLGGIMPAAVLAVVLRLFPIPSARAAPSPRPPPTPAWGPSASRLPTAPPSGKGRGGLACARPLRQGRGAGSN